MSDHYFSADPGSPEHRQTVVAEVWGRSVELVTASGVFSAGRLDVGTGVLFRAMDPPTRPGTFLDLGCGYGVIACALALTVDEARVWAVDVNERALALCAENAAALQVGERVIPSTGDQVPADLEFDEIWSNPPIRIGKAALHDLLLQWLRRLVPGGRAILVVGRNLGADTLQRWLVGEGYPCERVASAKGFRVLRATRPA